MSFADSLRNYSPEEEKQKKIEDGIKRSAYYAADFAEKAIKYSAATASRKGLHAISGYLVKGCSYDADPVYYLTTKWGEHNDSKFQSVNILQIDRLEDYNYTITTRYAHKIVTSETLERHRARIKLNAEEVSAICVAVESAIRKMGFSDYRVEAVPMHFYCRIEESRNGLFGKKYINKKIDDGIGQVLRIEVRW
ncbi:MAG: hypothetical protein J1F23_04660 [Oscillospiraceae bacterium]|nr:hypothetical protein [Oscillospiraceae bacterium]